CALVYPSWFEGFGIPILEAMSLGVPVICSNTSSMPEVAGDAALLVAPDDLQGWSDAMQRLATDNVLRDTLTEKGRKQASAFSWEESAKKITAIIRQQLADNDRKYFSTT
ncbi:MAG: glycosyltransferase, partial [Chitinophagales bacterium]|nr:glycosyltransferase [Chitinophagales bacterium]